MQIGQRIKEEMMKKGISQNKLAKAAQISQSGLSSIINGASSPKENTLQAIAVIFSPRFPDQLIHGHAQGGGQLRRIFKPWVILSGFISADTNTRHPGKLRQFLLGKAALFTDFPQFLYHASRSLHFSSDTILYQN